MKIISHRGNLVGRSNYENHPSFLREALEQGFAVEADLWQVGGHFFLGHDEPEYKIEIEEWDIADVYFHLKSPVLLDFKNADSFFLNNDRWAYTRLDKIWCNFDEFSGPDSILTSPELVGSMRSREEYIFQFRNAWGICTDFPLEYKAILSVAKFGIIAKAGR